jgi:acetyl-CoA carboxylase biotin carboxyl carrier protein
LDLRELKEILQILEEKEITEFELEEEGMKLRIRKAAASSNHSAPAAPVSLVHTLVPSALNVAIPPSPAPGPSVPAAAPALTAEEQGLVSVKSPIVGTFYRAPDPGSPPFVNVGDRVRVGQVLCIIEAMKLMNEIEAEAAGEIVKVHHETGQPVQYGEPLFDIRPA